MKAVQRYPGQTAHSKTAIPVLDTFSPEASSSQLLLGVTGKIADMLTEFIGHTSMRTVYKLMLAEDISMDAVKDYMRDLHQLFADVVLERGIKRGEISSTLSPRELARHFAMAIRGLCYEWCIRYPEFDLKRQALSHIGLLIDGIRAR